MMAESQDTLHETAKKTWKRRGLFAAAGAAVAGLVARVSEQRVEAGTDGDVVLGAGNPTTGVTSINNASPSSHALELFCTAGSSGVGLYAVGSGSGVTGFTTDGFPGSGAGVEGYSARADNVGVWGICPLGTGVLGQSLNGIAVRGNISSDSSAQTVAIYGVNAASYAGSVPGTGGWGVAGVSRYGHGVVGATSALGAGAVVGATNGIAGAYAGIFFGPAIVEGDFTVVGGAKSAAVPHPDGSHRRLYCVESPESWFEDFGKRQLACGHADVSLDPDFAAVVDLDDYHVFLTQYGGHDDLSVSEQTPRGFRVEAKDATASGRFSWRVVAKRKDVARARFERVVVPPKPQMPNIPEPPVSDLLRRPEVRHRQ